MSVSLYLADQANLQTPCSDISPVTFNDDGYYWFLYRYFESANLERHKGELIDLPGWFSSAGRAGAFASRLKTGTKSKSSKCFTSSLRSSHSYCQAPLRESLSAMATEVPNTSVKGNGIRSAPDVEP